MSLFNKFGWGGNDDDEDAGAQTNIFSHSKNYTSIAKEQAERERQRVEKAKAKEERRKVKSERKTSVKREGEGDGRGSSKKSRIDAEDSKKLLAKATAGFIQIDDSDEDTSCSEPQRKVRSSPRLQRTQNALSPAKPKSKLGEITANDDEDDFEITTVKKRPFIPEPPVEDEDSDPELAALKKKAREKRKQQQQPQSSTPNIASTSPGASADQSGQYPTPPPPDPVVQLLVTSPIPDSIPLIVCRKISQNLEPVKPAWIRKQPPDFPEYIAKNMFFTHCGKRLFDSTLVKRLGVVFDEHGRLHLDGDEFQEGMVKIHIEATTEHLFKQHQEAEQARAATAAAAAAAAEAATGDNQGEATDEMPAEPEKDIRITIKAKDKGDFKIRVFPDTLISKILKGARKNLGFDESQDLYLEFDGDRLNPDDRVRDTEIEDMMVLGLYLAN